MRVNLRATLTGLCASVLVLIVLWIQCGDIARKPGPVVSTTLVDHPPAPNEIPCYINGEYSIKCHRYSDEVYFPFSFIQKYFEVYGKVTTRNDEERFEWAHSYGKIHHPKTKYNPHGTFTTFENYNVEVRERVKCISGIEGVPVSTQWDPKGFYYPTQIAQYGLAHYSKNITEPQPKRLVLEDGDNKLADWIVSKDASLTRVFDTKVRSKVVKFYTSAEPSSEVILNLEVSHDLVLSLDLLLVPNSSLTVVLQHKEKKQSAYVHYTTSLELITAKDEHVYYGIGVNQTWRRLTRDLIVDVQKGWALQDKPKKKAPRNKFKITRMILRGGGRLDNVSLSASEHGAAFMAAACWLAARNGSWPVPVRRRPAPPAPELAAGWYSAMSQGHGMSVLCRAHLVTGEARYLHAARRALAPLERPSGAGGVRALFMGKYVWYEEYPTKPPLIVLNGFIYTLLGLYDLLNADGEDSTSLAKKMYDEGMHSLRTLLPLFDTGSGSYYDLRHFTLGVAPNIARWDYHATHVNLLYLLGTIDSDPIFNNTAKRWEGYMQGRRAAHN